MAVFSIGRVISQLLQAPARHRLRGPFVLASSNHIEIVGDLPIGPIRIKIMNLNPSCRFKILQSAKGRQCVVSHSKVV